MSGNVSCCICGFDLDEPISKNSQDWTFFECGRCGPYRISVEALTDLDFYLGDATGPKKALLSHAIRGQVGRDKSPVFVNSEFVRRVLEHGRLPSILEQTNNLVRWLGTTLKTPEETWSGRPEEFQSVIGSPSPKTVHWIVKHLRSVGYVPEQQTMGEIQLGLTFNGWRYFSEIERSTPDSRTVFMAMQYGNEQLDQLFDETLVHAVAQTGFDLVRTDRRPEAGLIDDRIRVQIRNSRLVVSDLSDNNFGAYWEAGFAEGLGKPVIYTCERRKFENEATHFDTNHHQTVLWDMESRETVAEELKATIRNTLPTEAKMTDD